MTCSCSFYGPWTRPRPDFCTGTSMSESLSGAVRSTWTRTESAFLAASAASRDCPYRALRAGPQSEIGVAGSLDWETSSGNGVAVKPCLRAGFPYSPVPAPCAFFHPQTTP